MRTAVLAGGGCAAAAAFAALSWFAFPGHPEAAGEAAAASSVARGEAVFRTCAACHTVGRQGADVDGPNLHGVVGARVAARRPRYGYTQALRDVGGTWTEGRLDAWLTDPAAFAPGTAMRFPGLADAGQRADVIAFLSTQAPVRR